MSITVRSDRKKKYKTADFIQCLHSQLYFLQNPKIGYVFHNLFFKRILKYILTKVQNSSVKNVITFEMFAFHSKRFLLFVHDLLKTSKCAVMKISVCLIEQVYTPLSSWVAFTSSIVPLVNKETRGSDIKETMSSLILHTHTNTHTF